MNINNKTIQYSIRAKIEGGNLEELGDTSSVQLPSWEYATDTISGPGILGEIDFPSYLGLKSATFSFNMRVDEKRAAIYSAPGRKWFEVRWATDKFDTSQVKIGITAHKALILGVPKKYDAGKVEVGNAQEGSNEYEVLYYKKYQDGEEVIEIDKLNGIFRVNGVDYASDVVSVL